MKTPERRQCRSVVFIVNFEHISHFVLVFLLLLLSRKMFFKHLLIFPNYEAQIKSGRFLQENIQRKPRIISKISPFLERNLLMNIINLVSVLNCKCKHA